MTEKMGERKANQENVIDPARIFHHDFSAGRAYGPNISNVLPSPPLTADLLPALLSGNERKTVVTKKTLQMPS